MFFLLLSFLILFAGPANAADLIFHAADLTGRDTTNFIEYKSGHIVVPAGIGLVNSSAYEGTGTLSEAQLFDHRFRLAASETRGPQDADARNAANPFTASGHERTVNLSGGAWRDGDDRLTFNGTMVETSQLLIDGDTGLPIGDEQNRALGSGLNFTTDHNRLRGLAEMAWSRNSAPDAPGDETDGRSERFDGAWRARLDADILKGDGRALTAWGYRRRVDPGYVATRGDAPADRDETAVGGHGRMGMTTLDIAFIEFFDNLDRQVGTLTTRDRTASVTVGFDLSHYRLRRFAPRALRFTASRGSEHGMPGLSNGTFSPDAITDERRLRFGTAADWPVAVWGQGETLTLAVTHSATDNRQPGKETADTSDDTVGLTHTIARRSWTGSLSASAANSMNAEVGNRSVTRKYALSASAATTTRAADRLSLSINVAQDRTTGLDYGVNGDVDTTWQITAGGAFNRILGDGPLAGVMPIVGYVSVKGNDPDSTDSGVRTVDMTAGFKVRLTF